MRMRTHEWRSPPASPELASDAVHVWRASFDRPLAEWGNVMHILSADEQARSRRFHFEQDRQRFIAGRAILRILLGRYLQIAPEELRFDYGAQGKPVLTPVHGIAPIRFNIAHSQGLALFAFTRDREIGVDLEHIRPIADWEQIAGRFFSRYEYAALGVIPADRQLEAFFTCWTRKEAYIKARGNGLSMRLDGFDVSLASGDEVMLVNVRDQSQEAARWSLRELLVAPGYVAALAVEGQGFRVDYWQWPDGD